LKSAADYYNRPANQGHAIAQAHYPGCLECRTGVAIDLKSAADWYKKSTDQESAIAQVCDGLSLAHGRALGWM
jgi:TPR repeat protein